MDVTLLDHDPETAGASACDAGHNGTVPVPTDGNSGWDDAPAPTLRAPARRGRGATGNPGCRYDAQSAEAFDDG